MINLRELNVRLIISLRAHLFVEEVWPYQRLLLPSLYPIALLFLDKVQQLVLILQN